MPRRSALLLTTLAALFLVTSLVYYTSGAAQSSWGVPQWRSGSAAQQTPTHLVSERDALQALELSSSFEYRRICVEVKPKSGLHRTSLDEVPKSLLPQTSVDLKSKDELPPCQETVHLDVPYFKPHAAVDTSRLMLGMATMLHRINDSIPELSRWLSNTGSPLVVLLVDQLDLQKEAAKIEEVHAKAANVGIEIIFEPYKGKLKDTEGLKNFALAEVLQKNRRESTEWFGIVDDDTFFVSLPTVLDELRPFDPTKQWYIGALTEAISRVKVEGFKAWGGAGFFVSPPLLEEVAAHSKPCRALDTGFGDILWRDCILNVTSPTVKLTQMPGLNQIDVWGDISGWYEAPHERLLSVHHWKSWHFHPIPEAHTVIDVAGPETFLQRYLFEGNVVMTNGYSINQYPGGVPDLHRAELTFADDVNKPIEPAQAHPLQWHHSLGVTRPMLKLGKEKISWIFEMAMPGFDGSVRQFYVKKRDKEKEGSKDSVVEIDWQRR